MPSYGGPVAALTQDEAIARAALIEVHDYDIDLDVTAADGFTSRSRIGFSSRTSGRTFVDVAPRTLDKVLLDGAGVDVGGWSDGRLELSLEAGRHELVVEAQMAYSNDGEGLHRYVDPADGQTYLYAMTFLDAAPRVFACFDQPDLKATFRTSVTAPAGWTVIGNSRAGHDGAGRWQLAATPRLSTYFWTVVAGPYASVMDEHDGIRLGVHAMASLGEHLEQQSGELFAVTGQAFDAFHRMFGIRYPFGDYHQAFVPEFNAGAMENPGCVTFRDSMIFRSAATDADRGERARVVVHEMAHMWFGDLVTMRWWDDLWLNESFAEYMAHRVTHEATSFQDSWVDFGFTRKPWGLAADQRTSTHPVAGNGAPDSHRALDDFDGISYAKGAAVLQQLVGHLGDDVFLAGVRRHLEAHAYGNATLADLFGSWKASGATDIEEWSQSWLRTAGPDTLHWEDGHLVRTPPEGSDARRPHRVQLLGVGPDGPRTEDVRVDAERTPVSSAPAPGAPLLIDATGQTWARIRYDADTLAALPSVLPGVVDPVTRASVWLAVRDGVDSGWITPGHAVDLLAAALPSEDQDVGLIRLATWAEEHLLGRFLPETADVRGRIGDALLSRIESAAAGSSLQLAAAMAWSQLSHDTDRLAAWHDGLTPEGLTLDAELRWAVVRQLARLGSLDSADVDAEARRDHSAQGTVHAARCRASLPDAATKAAVWDRVVGDRSASNYELFAWCEGFWYAEQTELCTPYVQRYFTDIPATAHFRAGLVTSMCALLAFPRYHVSAATELAATRTLQRSDLSTEVRRSVGDATDDLRRAMAVRKDA
jgi:aminopeptidase N